MKTNKNRLLVLLLIAVIAMSAALLVACDGSASSVNGTYYYWNYNKLDKTQYYTLKNGTWTNEAGESGDYEVNGTSITLYVEFFGSRQEYFSGTVKDGVLTLSLMGQPMFFYKDVKAPQGGTNNPNGNNQTTKNKYTVTYDANGGAFDNGNTFTQQVEEGSKLTAPSSPTRKNYTFAGWAKNKNGSTMWQFDTDTITEDTTLYAQWTQESAVILSVDGASMDGTSIYMFVTHEVDSVSLSNKVVCSDDSIWRLYYDRMGQTEIPTKVAAGMTGYLSNGENVFYIVVTSQNGAQVNLYELTVYRSYAVNVNYYDGTTLLNTETAYTGVEFTTKYKPNITGYTFNSWKDSSGKTFTSDTLWSTTSLYADKTANTYTATFNVNGGNSLEQTKQTMTYDKSYTFPVPTRTGYTFTGWYAGNTQITNSSGRSLSNWNYDSNTTVTAHWQANNYKLTLTTNNSNAGTVIGDGEITYGSQVTITANTNAGYTWVGWFDGNKKLTDEQSYTFTMGLATSYTARWSKVTLDRNNTSAGTISSLSDKYKVGDEVTITAFTNTGYTFVGWFNGNTKLTDELSYTFTMTDKDVSYIAQWSKVALSRNNTSAGTVGGLTGKYLVGDEATITASTNTGYTFVGWFNGNTKLTDELSYTFTMTDKDVTYTAQWSKVTLSRNDISAGTVSSLSGKYKVGDEVTVTASTNTGYTFVGWFNGNTKLTDELSYTFTMTDKDVTYTAQWTYYTVTTNTNDRNGGSYTILTNKKTTLGDEVTITASTNQGYTWDGWFSGETKLTNELSYTFIMSAESVTYTARWSYYTVTTNAINGAAGTYSEKTNEKITVGTTVTLSAQSENIGYIWLGWFDGDELLTEELFYTFKMQANNINYTAIWAVVSELQNFNFTSTATTCVLTGVIDKSVTEIIVPDYITRINGGAFKGCSNLETIKIPFIGRSPTTHADTYQYPFGYIFGTSSYDGSSAIKQSYYGSSTNSTTSTTYYIPSSLRTVILTGGENIPRGAFYNCSILTSITIPEGVTSIGNYAFYDCTSLTNITIPENVKTIENGTFMDCSGLSTVYWNAINCTIVSEYLVSPFKGCTNLTTVVFGEGVQTIPDGTFLNCQTLVTIIFDGVSKLSEIGNYAFEDCNSLTSITIPEGVTSIGFGAFSGCSNLTEIIIPEAVTLLGDGAFDNCTNLKTIYWNAIDSRVAGVSGSLFDGCVNVTDVIIGYNVEVMPCIFSKCINIQTVYWNATACIDTNSISRGLFRYITSVVISENVQIIPWYTFWSSKGLVAVYYCGTKTQWNNISIENHNDYLKNATRYYYSAEEPALNEQGEGYNGNYWHWADDGVSPEIWTCSKLEEFEIEDNVLKKYNGNGGDVVIPQGVTEIAENVFRNNESITSITIPESLKNIRNGVFFGCTNLVNVYYQGDIVGWCNITFNGQTSNPLSNGANLYMGNSLATNLTIPNTVAEIKANAFSNCISLQSITLSSNLVSIGQEAFIGCINLTNIEIPNSVTSVGNSAFFGCSNLVSATIGNGVKTIDDYAFWFCTSLKSVTIGNSVESIGYEAFYGCENLASVTFSNTEGWWLTSSANATNGTNINAFDLLDSATAAKYLSITYRDYYWKHS